MKSVASNTSPISFMSSSQSSFLFKYLNRLTSKLTSTSSVNKIDSDMLSFLAKEYGSGKAELTKEVAVEEIGAITTIDTEEEATNFFMSVWETSTFDVQERLYAIYLDSTNRVVGWKLISTGTTSIKNSSPASILLMARELSANKVILAHNHPSGVNKTSASDVEYNNLVLEACLNGHVELVAHFILTRNGHHAIKQNRS